MLIRKINSGLMKHSRWLFGIFTVIIIVSFVGFLTPTSSVFGLFNRDGADSVGTVYGENVGVETITRINPQLENQSHDYMSQLHSGRDERFNREYHAAHDEYFGRLNR